MESLSLQPMAYMAVIVEPLTLPCPSVDDVQAITRFNDVVDTGVGAEVDAAEVLMWEESNRTHGVGWARAWGTSAVRRRHQVREMAVEAGKANRRVRERVSNAVVPLSRSPPRVWLYCTVRWFPAVRVGLFSGALAVCHVHPSPGK